MRLVELATYLGISRPTLYKYLELYENKDYNEIDKKCFDLFSFIDKNKNIQRHVIMDYLINKVIPIQEASESEIEVISMVRKLSDSSNEIDRKKFQLIGQIVASDKYDDVLDTLIKLSNES
jgi:DNA-binding CsgD family transcriptional regulator